MKFIDTHTHLFLPQYNEDIDEVVKRAINSNIEKMLLPNISIGTIDDMLNLCEKYPSIFHPMIGIHPCEINNDFEDDLKYIEKIINEYKFVAVGEIGIDLHWKKDNLESQKKAFKSQILLAKKNNLPIVIHNRNSFEETIEIVENLNDHNLRGVFHCYNGDIEQANRILDLGDFFLGIGGVITFKNSKMDETIKQIPLENIVIETDSPFLTPYPYRGKRNESKYIVNIAEKISEIKKIDLNIVANITTENAIKLFKL
tara:strand:- start:3311 stop:4081 length:771 start_codon:yes stop_codon:yes gene_type:complete